MGSNKKEAPKAISNFKDKAGQLCAYTIYCIQHTSRLYKIMVVEWNRVVGLGGDLDLAGQAKKSWHF